MGCPQGTAKYSIRFLAAFAKFRKAILSSSCIFLRPFICLSAWNNSSIATDFNKIWYFRIFGNLWINLKYHYSVTLTDALHEDRLKFILISRWIPLKMRTGSHNSCEENLRTHFYIFNTVFNKVVPFVRQCGKIRHSHTSQRV